MASSRIEIYQARFTYEGIEGSGDLSFKQGDMITVLNKMGFWWEGSLSDGQSGCFPASCVELPRIPPPEGFLPPIIQPTHQHVQQPRAIPPERGFFMTETQREREQRQREIERELEEEQRRLREINRTETVQRRIRREANRREKERALAEQFEKEKGNQEIPEENKELPDSVLVPIEKEGTRQPLTLGDFQSFQSSLAKDVIFSQEAERREMGGGEFTDERSIFNKIESIKYSLQEEHVKDLQSLVTSFCEVFTLIADQPQAYVSKGNLYVVRKETGFSVISCRGDHGRHGKSGLQGENGFDGYKGKKAFSSGGDGGYGGNGGHGDDGSNGFDGQNGGNAISLSGKYAAVISETSVEVVRTQEKTNTTRRVLMSPHMQDSVELSPLEYILINARGGNGGNGGRGGNGGDGGYGGYGANGRNGKDGDDGGPGENGEDGEDGGDGGHGGYGDSGGNGGNGGNGGDAGNGGLVIIKSPDPGLFMHVLVDQLPGSVGLGGANGTKGIGGAGGIGGEGGKGGKGGKGGPEKKKTVIRTEIRGTRTITYRETIVVKPAGRDGKHGKPGRPGADGSSGREGNEGSFGHPGKKGKPGKTLYVVTDPSCDKIIERGPTRFEPIVREIYLSKPVDDGIFSPGDEISVTNVKVQNFGSISCPEGMKLHFPSTPTIRALHPEKCHIFPKIERTESRKCPVQFLLKLQPLPPPDLPGYRRVYPNLFPFFTIKDKQLDKASPIVTLQVRYPIKIECFQNVPYVTLGETMKSTLRIHNLSQRLISDRQDNKVRVTVYFDPLLEIESVENARRASLKSFESAPPFYFEPVTDVGDNPARKRKSKWNAFVIDLGPIQQRSTQAIHFHVKLRDEGRSCAYLRVGWQAHLELMRDEEEKGPKFKLVQFETSHFRISPAYTIDRMTDAANCLLVCDKHLSRLQYLSWEFLFHLLLLTFDIWDVEQSQGISENPKFQKSLPFYSKNMVVIHLSTPNQLTLLSPHDIINYFRQDEGTNFVGGMLIINAEMENIYNRVLDACERESAEIIRSGMTQTEKKLHRRAYCGCRMKEKKTHMAHKPVYSSINIEVLRRNGFFQNKKVAMTYAFHRTPFLKTVKFWTLPPDQHNILSGVAPLVTPRDTPSPKGATRLGVYRDFAALIPASSTFSKILTSVMLIMPLEDLLQFFDKNEKAKRWEDTLKAGDSGPMKEDPTAPSRPEERSLSARFPGNVPQPLYYQWHERRAAQFRWGVKNERIYPFSELIRQSYLVYLRRDIVYKRVDYLDLLREVLLGEAVGVETEKVAICVHYLLTRLENGMSLRDSSRIAIFNSKFGEETNGIIKRISQTIKKTRFISKQVELIYEQYSEHKCYVALLGITGSLRGPLIVETWNQKNVELKEKKNVKLRG